MVARRAHNPKAESSNLSSATKLEERKTRSRQMESEDGSSSSMRRVPLNGRQPVSKTGVARKAKGSIPSPSSSLRPMQFTWASAR